MDFGLSEEQRLIVETTRAFVENELYPHEQEVERTGHLRRELIEEMQGQGDRRRALCRQHAGRCRRRRARYADLAALREGARPRQLRAALDLRGAALEHPARRHARAAREISLPLHPRREIGLPGHDRARRRLRPARHEGDRRRRTATTGCSTAPSISSATPTSPISPSSSWPRARRIRRAASARRSPPSSSTRARKGFTVRDGYRNVSHRGYTNSILEFDDCRLPDEPGARRGAQGLRGRQFLARRDAAAGRARPASAAPSARSATPSNTPRSASSSASRSASSRACRSSSPTWRPS